VLLVSVGLVLGAPRPAGGVGDVAGARSAPIVDPGDCAATWSVAETPNVDAGTGQIDGIAATSATERWAVGDFGVTRRPTPLVLHGTPAGWRIEPIPLGAGSLHDVAGAASDDVWAVGDAIGPPGGPGGPRTLAMHYDGTRWTIVPGPTLDVVAPTLRGVAAVAPDDAWAVGSSGGELGPTRALAEHWDGSAWHEVDLPLPGPAELTGVSATSANDAWAVGTRFDSSPIGTLAMHWDGSAWSVVPTPSPSSAFNQLAAVSAVGPDDAWAVGRRGSAPLVLRWNGLHWRVVATPPVGGALTQLADVAAGGPDEAWAVGTTGGEPGSPYILRWNGAQWADVPAPSPPDRFGSLATVAVATSGGAWAAGRSDANGDYPRTFALRWNGSQWNLTPSPSPPTARWNLLQAVDAVPGGDLWIGGSGATALAARWTGGRWRLSSPPGLEHPGDAVVDVDGAGSGDVWAMGQRFELRPATVRWRGSGWESHPVPAGDVVRGVATLAPDDAWAAGFRPTGGRTNGLILHWDGSSWRTVALDLPGTGSRLEGIDADGPDDVWAVGSSEHRLGPRTLVMHWNGVRWRVAPSPNAESPTESTDDRLQDVTAIGPRDVWAVGFHRSRALTIHWDGIRWTVVPVPAVGGNEFLAGVDATGPRSVWAAGTALHRPLLEHWDGTAWAPVSIPNTGKGALNDVSVGPSGEVWAAGWRQRTVARTLLECGRTAT